MLTKKILAAALSCAALATAHAAEAPKPLPTASSGLSPFLGIGLTFGGDQIGEDIPHKDDDNSSSIYAGRLIDLRAGLEYQASGSPVSFQLSLSYHVDRSTANNGSVTFSRFPLEALVHYRVADAWRIGGGLRKALSAESDASGAGRGWVPETEYKSSTGLVLEAETFFGPRFGLKLRAVSEEYTPQSGVSRKKIDGSHIGVIGVYYFK